MKFNSKAEQDIGKNGVLAGIALGGSAIIFLFHYLYNNLGWDFVFAVIVYYGILCGKSFVYKYAGEKAFKNNKEVWVEVGLMPWINGAVFALSVDVIMYVMLSKIMQPLWASNGLLGPLDIEISEYLIAWLIVSGLLYVLQYSLTRKHDEEIEIEKSSKEHHERERHEHAKPERGVTHRG